MKNDYKTQGRHGPRSRHADASSGKPHGGAPGGRPRFERRPRSDTGEVVLYGIHAVEAALLNPARPVKRLLLTENAARRLSAALASRGPQVERSSPRDIDRLVGADAVHQGAVLMTEGLASPPLDDLAAATGPGRVLVVLDQVTDPHNVGAVLRSAAAFGAVGLVMTDRHSPPLDGVLAKAASGALEHVPVHLAQNLARALTSLGELGLTRIGLDGGAEERLEAAAAAGLERVALVLGAEGDGLRHLTRETCDRLCRLSTTGPIASLNVSTAAAVALHTLCVLRPAGGPSTQKN